MGFSYIFSLKPINWDMYLSGFKTSKMGLPAGWDLKMCFPGGRWPRWRVQDWNPEGIPEAGFGSPQQMAEKIMFPTFPNIPCGNQTWLAGKWTICRLFMISFLLKLPFMRDFHGFSSQPCLISRAAEGKSPIFGGEKKDFYPCRSDEWPAGWSHAGPGRESCIPRSLSRTGEARRTDGVFQWDLDRSGVLKMGVLARIPQDPSVMAIWLGKTRLWPFGWKMMEYCYSRSQCLDLRYDKR